MKYFNLFGTQDPFVANEIRQLLDSEDIPYRILNEYRLHKENDFGDMFEDAVFQVPESFVLRANHALISNGYKLSQSAKCLDKQPSIQPEPLSAVELFLDRYPLRLILYVFFGVAVGIPMSLALISLFQSYQIELEDWGLCARKITYQKKVLHPHSEDIMVVFNCREKIYFHSDGSVSLPGFNTPMVRGSWQYMDGRTKVRIYHTDRFSHIYDGVYRLKVKFNSRLKLQSEHTSIVLSEQ